MSNPHHDLLKNASAQIAQFRHAGPAGSFTRAMLAEYTALSEPARRALVAALAFEIEAADLARDLDAGQ